MKVENNLYRNLDVLKKIISKIDNSYKYVVSGSTSLAFQGVDVVPNDIDIFTDKAGVDYFYSILKRYTNEPPKIKETDEAISYYIKCFIDDVQVEIIGDFITKNQDGTFNESTINYDEILFKEYKNVSIPVMPLSLELIGYQQLNRIEKVKKIQEAMNLNKK